jgi:hypothetical protein
MKNVLVVYYSQSGQLESIARNIANPLLDSTDINVTFHEIQLEKPFPFPWDTEAFFDAFPESFLQIPTALKPISPEIMNTKFDLILLNYQVWYLSPSIPINSFLKSPEAKILLNNTPVITISGSRNMWILAQEKIKKLLKQNNALLKGNIALVDRAGNLISVVTIFDWMLSGIKRKYLGIFPLPGVSDKDIQDSSIFGKAILSSLNNNDLENLQTKLVELDAVRVKPFLITVDRTGNKIFTMWSNFIVKKGESRKSWLKVFKMYLFVAIWIISPIVFVFYLIFYPLMFNKIRKEKLYYKGIVI